MSAVLKPVLTWPEVDRRAKVDPIDALRGLSTAADLLAIVKAAERLAVELHAKKRLGEDPKGHLIDAMLAIESEIDAPDMDGFELVADRETGEQVRRQCARTWSGGR